MAGSKAPIVLGAAAVGLFMMARGGLFGGGGRGGSPRTTKFNIDNEVDLTGLLEGAHLLSIPGDKIVIQNATPEKVSYEINENADVAGWLKITPVGFGGTDIVIERVVPVQISTEETLSGPMKDMKPGDTVEPQIAAIDFRLLPSETVYQVNVLTPRKA
jgi:hypothetical protein